jgi:hypothetical protein
MDGEPLAIGDTFLYMPMDGEAYDDTDPLFGHVLRWDGNSWESTTDSHSIGIAAKDAFKIARESGKVIFAEVIYTEAMVAANIQAGSGTGEEDSGFRFRAMDDDYSQEGSPKVPVFDVYKDDRQLFKVHPETGVIEFGEHFRYDPNADNGNGAIITNNNKLSIYADGRLEANDAILQGVEIVDGVFKGIFDTNALRLEPGDLQSYSRSHANNYYQALDLIQEFLSLGFSYNIKYRITLNTDANVKYMSFYWGDDVFGSIWTTYHSWNGIKFYNSQLQYLYEILTYEIEGDLSESRSIKIDSSITITIYYGGDKLYVSENIPTTDEGLDAWQIWLDETTLKVKLPS